MFTLRSQTVLVRYGTVRYGTVRYSTVRYGTVQHGAVRYGTVRYSTVRHGTVQHGTARHGTVRYSTVRHGTARYGTARCGTVRYGKRDVYKQRFIAPYRTVPISASTLGAVGLMRYASVRYIKIFTCKHYRANAVPLQVVQCIAEGDMCCQQSQ